MNPKLMFSPYNVCIVTMTMKNNKSIGYSKENAIGEKVEHKITHHGYILLFVEEVGNKMRERRWSQGYQKIPFEEKTADQG